MTVDALASTKGAQLLILFLLSVVTKNNLNEKRNGVDNVGMCEQIYGFCCSEKAPELKAEEEEGAKLQAELEAQLKAKEEAKLRAKEEAKIDRK